MRRRLELRLGPERCSVKTLQGAEPSTDASLKRAAGTGRLQARLQKRVILLLDGRNSLSGKDRIPCELAGVESSATHANDWHAANGVINTPPS